MRAKFVVFALAVALLFGGAAQAGSDLNEVGALLVYPAIVALENNVPDIYESYVTITNASSLPVTAHISYINGEPGPTYCYECDFSIELSGNDTELLILRWDPIGGVVIEAEPDGFGGNYFQFSCEFEYGMLVVSLEDGAGNTVTDNVLLGEQIVVNYTDGYALSFPAIPFQGVGATDGNRRFGFDDLEYGKMPRIVAADFIAPNDPGAFGQLYAQLVLFTLNFERQFPPFVDCSVTGYDADENPFSRSIQFGCWDWFDLQDISPEFKYPNLGLFAQADTHGWLQLNCSTLGITAANGGVHGAIVQRLETGAIIRRNDPAAPALANPAAFARLLYQSVTTGDPVTLAMEEPACFPTGAPCAVNVECCSNSCDFGTNTCN